MHWSHISLPLFIIVICSSINSIQCQLNGSCSMVVASDLGSTSNFSRAGIVGRFISGTGAQILEFNVICLSTSVRRNTYRTAAVTVRYSCLACNQSSPGTVMDVTEVFTLGCDGFTNSWTALGSDPVPLTFLSTPLEKKCSSCIAPSLGQGMANYDNSTFCLRKN